MKRPVALAILLAAAAAAIPSSAAASAANCRAGAALVEQCRELATCVTISAAIFNHSTPEEAVRFTRRCLALDRRYVLKRPTTRGMTAAARSRRLRAAESKARALYCLAVRRAGRTDSRICRVRSRRTGGRTGGGGGGSAPDSGRDPAFTG